VYGVSISHRLVGLTAVVVVSDPPLAGSRSPAATGVRALGCLSGEILFGGLRAETSAVTGPVPANHTLAGHAVKLALEGIS
jgi:hypothetical protein